MLWMECAQVWGEKVSSNRTAVTMFMWKNMLTLHRRYANFKKNCIQSVAKLFSERSKNNEKKTKFKKYTYHIIDHFGNMGIVLFYKFCIRCICHIESSIFPFIVECERKTHAPFLHFYNHYALACKYHTNTDNSVLSVDETCKT